MRGHSREELRRAYIDNLDLIAINESLTAKLKNQSQRYQEQLTLLQQRYINELRGLKTENLRLKAEQQSRGELLRSSSEERGKLQQLSQHSIYLQREVQSLKEQLKLMQVQLRRQSQNSKSIKLQKSQSQSRIKFAKLFTVTIEPQRDLTKQIERLLIQNHQLKMTIEAQKLKFTKKCTAVQTVLEIQEIDPNASNSFLDLNKISNYEKVQTSFKLRSQSSERKDYIMSSNLIPNTKQRRAESSSRLNTLFTQLNLKNKSQFKEMLERKEFL